MYEWHRYQSACVLSPQAVVYCHGGRIGFYQGDIRLLPDDMKALRPTIFPVVPRLLNRMYDKVRWAWGLVRLADLGLGLSESCLNYLRFPGVLGEALLILSSTAKQITVITSRNDCPLSLRSSAKRTHRWSAGCSTLLLREKVLRSAGGSSAATASGTKFSSVRYRWRYIMAVLATDWY